MAWGKKCKVHLKGGVRVGWGGDRATERKGKNQGGESETAGVVVNRPQRKKFR